MAECHWMSNHGSVYDPVSQAGREFQDGKIMVGFPSVTSAVFERSSYDQSRHEDAIWIHGPRRSGVNLSGNRRSGKGVLSCRRISLTVTASRIGRKVAASFARRSGRHTLKAPIHHWPLHG